MRQAELVSFEGVNNVRPVKLRQYLNKRMDKADYEQLMGSDSITKVNIDYLNNKYPDLMGIWPAIAKVLGKVGSLVGRGIKKAVARKKAQKEEANARKQVAQVQFAAQQETAAQLQAKKKKTIMIVGAVGVAGLAFILMSKKK